MYPNLRPGPKPMKRYPVRAIKRYIRTILTIQKRAQRLGTGPAALQHYRQGQIDAYADVLEMLTRSDLPTIIPVRED